MKDCLLHASFAPTPRKRMNGPGEVCAVKVAFVLRAFVKGGDVLDCPSVPSDQIQTVLVWEDWTWSEKIWRKRSSLECRLGSSSSRMRRFRRFVDD